jgi:hypothetical protein
LAAIVRSAFDGKSMKHVFVMNCHRDLAQAAISVPLYRRFWGEHSALYFYYDGPPGYDPATMATVLANVTKSWTSDVEPRKSTSIFNALNVMAEEAAVDGADLISFVHADMIPLFRAQFYGFLDRFWQTGKLVTHGKMWPTADYIDFANLHFRVRDAMALKLLPIEKLRPELDFNEAEATMSFDRMCPDWRERAYRMWSITWPISGSAMMRPGVPAYYHPSADKTGHDLAGSFVIHNYLPESSVIHVNDAYFWQNYSTLSDVMAPLSRH